MKAFKHFNNSSNCPICGKNNDGEAVLLPIDDTSDGSISEAMQVHLECLNLRVKRLDGINFAYQQFEAKK